jgi:glyoxylase-like metal-dependent hydrolase (beta-lactamase superfamily II)
MSTTMVTTDPASAQPMFFGETEEVAPDVLMHPMFVNTYAVRLPAGLLLVDPGLRPPADAVHAAVRRWCAAPVHTAVYTHGHVDHAFGLAPYLAAGERPRIVAQENCLGRFRRYGQMYGWNAAINQRQFGLPQPVFVRQFDWPTLVVRDALVERIGEVEVHYTAAKGETDDHLTIWIPSRRYLFTGDLIIWQAPNCGNPQKVQRYPEEWAAALESMAGLGAEWLFPGHGLAVRGADAVRTVLTETARYLRGIVDAVRARMNAGETPEDIFHAVDPDPELARRAYLQPTYDHPKFIVRNLLRLWGGWWNGNAADLLPARWSAQAEEIVGFAGGVDRIVARGRALLDAGDAVMAAHLAEWATRAVPADRAAQALKRDVYARRLADEGSLMAQGIYRAAMHDAQRALGEEPTGGGRRAVTRMML